MRLKELVPELVELILGTVPVPRPSPDPPWDGPEMAGRVAAVQDRLRARELRRPDGCDREPGGEEGGALVGGQVEVLAPGVTLRVGSV